MVDSISAFLFFRTLEIGKVSGEAPRIPKQALETCYVNLGGSFGTSILKKQLRRLALCEV